MACENAKVKECPCPKTECENHFRCCACVLRHLTVGGLPFCFRDKFVAKPEGE